MWLAPVARLILLGVTAYAPGGPPSAALPEPIVTRQMLFAIPFRVEPADDPSREPAEVQLLVSGDDGAHWYLYSRATPTQRQFLFRAGAEGEFWFRIRTVDGSGQVRPESTELPGLRVIVDTQPPELKLEATRGEAGQITARWQIDEQHPQPASLTLQYRSADGTWQQVAVGEMNYQELSPPAQSGTVTWWAQTAAGPVQIRAEVADAAGNRAVSQAQVDLPQAPGAGSDLSHTAGAGPDAWRSEGGPPARQTWPAENAVWQLEAGGAAAPPVDAGGVSPGAGTAPQDYDPGPAPGAAYGQQRDARSYDPTGRSTDGGWQNGNSSVGSQPDIGQGPSPQTGVPSGLADRRAPSPLDVLPPGVRPQMVNSPRFELDYDISSFGPSGVSRVELWATEDGGQTWRSLTLDPDNRSPVQAAVDREGIYGLRVVASGRTGGGSGPPRPGDQPEIWLGVDLSKPEARITGAWPRRDGRDGELVIAWEASDMLLADRPISLLYAENPAGPWTPIAIDLENTGSYAWPISPRTPPAVYLRLEVRDEAGNVATVDTEQPVSLDGGQPPAHARAVRPVRQSSQVEPKRYYFQ